VYTYKKSLFGDDFSDLVVVIEKLLFLLVTKGHVRIHVLVNGLLDLTRTLS